MYNIYSFYIDNLGYYYVPNEYMDFVEAFEALNEVKKKGMNCDDFEAELRWVSLLFDISRSPV